MINLARSNFSEMDSDFPISRQKKREHNTSSSRRGLHTHRCASGHHPFPVLLDIDSLRGQQMFRVNQLRHFLGRRVMRMEEQFPMIPNAAKPEREGNLLI